jgi:hypothetical protein
VSNDTGEVVGYETDWPRELIAGYRADESGTEIYAIDPGPPGAAFERCCLGRMMPLARRWKTP